MKDAFDSFLENRKYECVVAFTAKGKEILRRGSLEALPWKGLADALVGTSDAVSRLAKSVPLGTFQIFGQGKVQAAAFRPQADLLIIIFNNSEVGSVGSYRHAKAAMQELLLLFSNI